MFVISCGYQVGFDNPQGKLQQNSLKIEKIYIKPLKNRSSEMMLGVWLTEELRNEFLRNGGIVVSSLDEADFILEGEVKSLDTLGISFVRYDQAVERRLNATFIMKLIRKSSGEVIWKEENMQREESFFVGREIMETEGLKDDALRRLSLYIAQHTFHKITSAY
jgi:hypothetical protein